MEYENFNDTPQSKVGTMGAMFIKKRLEGFGYKLLPPPVVYPSGGSPVDQTVQFPDGTIFYAEYMTRRQKTYRDVQTFYMGADKWQRIIKLYEEKKVATKFYITDVSQDFNPAIKDAPCIWRSLLNALKEKCNIDGADFPAEDEQEIWTNEGFVTKKFIYFPVERFTKISYLTQEERNMINPLFEEMDTRTPKNSLPKTSTCRQANWAQDTLKAETKLFYSVTENTKTSTEKILTPEEKAKVPKVIEAGYIANFYCVPVPKCDPENCLKFYKYDNKNWIIEASSLIRTVSNKKNFRYFLSRSFIWWKYSKRYGKIHSALLF